MIPGELETTMFHRFCQAQNLRALLKPESIPYILHPFINIFMKFFSHQMKGAGSIDNLPYDETYKLGEENSSDLDQSQTRFLAPDERMLLSTWIEENDGECVALSVTSRVHSRRTIHRLGQTFSTREVSLRDSNISYRSASGSQWDAASISQMFTHTRERRDGSKKTQTFVFVNKYASSAPELNRPYLRYPHLGIRVFDTELEPEKTLLSFDQVLCHISCSHFNFGGEAGGKDCLISVQLSRI